MAGIEDVGSGARSLRPTRRDKGGSRNWGCQDGLDDLACRRDETARRVHPQDDKPGSRRARLLETTLYIVGAPYADGALEIEDVDQHLRARRNARAENSQTHQNADNRSGHCETSLRWSPAPSQAVEIRVMTNTYLCSRLPQRKFRWTVAPAISIVPGSGGFPITRVSPTSRHRQN